MVWPCFLVWECYVDTDVVPSLYDIVVYVCIYID